MDRLKTTMTAAVLAGLWVAAATSFAASAVADCALPSERADLTLVSVTIDGEASMDFAAYQTANYELYAEEGGVSVGADDYFESYDMQVQP